jgi:hypothetical protein
MLRDAPFAHASHEGLDLAADRFVVDLAPRVDGESAVACLRHLLLTVDQIAPNPAAQRELLLTVFGVKPSKAAIAARPGQAFPVVAFMKVAMQASTRR